jgi:hypothetical protein
MTPTERDDIILIERNRVVLVGFDLREKIRKNYESRRALGPNGNK